MTWSNPFAEGVAGMPVVQRIRIRKPMSGTHDDGTPGDYHLFQVILEFDRVITQTNTRVQYWRYKRPMRSNRNQYAQVGFRAIKIPGANPGFPDVAVPVGSRSVTLGQLRQLFLPPPVRNSSSSSGNTAVGQGRYHIEQPTSPAQYPTNLPRPGTNQGTKVTLKFGVETANQQRGPMSTETLIIWLWRYANAGSSGYYWNLRAEVK